MKITLEAFSQTFTIENDHDDCAMDEVVQLLRQLLVGSGFAEETVREYLGEE